MTLTDARGLEVSTTNRAALEQLDAATALMAGFRADPLAEVDAALRLQPDFAMAHAFRAGLMVMGMERGGVEDARAAIAAAGAVSGTTERERMHLAAASAWVEGDIAEAQARYGDIAWTWPRDLFALQVAHQLDFFLGDAEALRARPTASLRAWRRGEPGFGWLRGMQAFGLEESGEYRRAEEAGREALDTDPTDAWAVHAVAHVLEMQGRDREGVEWLARREADWTQGALLAVHNWWHLALFELERGAFDKVFAIYDRSVAPHDASIAIELVDASAMLWRLLLRGVEAAGRFEALSDAWTRLGGEGFYAFNDLHAVMAHLGAGRMEEAARVIAAMRRAAAGGGTNARLTREIGLPLAQGFAAFHRGEHAQAVRLIAPVRPRAAAFGGSHAQRDVLSLTLLEAALRGGEEDLARSLAAERVQAKPDSPLAHAFAARARRVAA